MNWRISSSFYFSFVLSILSSSNPFNRLLPSQNKWLKTKKLWPPLDFSALSQLYLDFTFRVILYLKILYYNIQCLGKSTKGSVWSLPPSSCLSSRPPAPVHRMTSRIYLTASACCLVCKKNSSTVRFVCVLTALICLQVTMHPFSSRNDRVGHWIRPQFVDFVHLVSSFLCEFRCENNALLI